MLFNSLHFLFFLPVVVALYYLLPFRFRWILIFVASCYFYMAFIPSYILILFAVILIDYFSAIWIEASEGRKRKMFLVASLVANITLLSFFKYFNFFVDNVSALLSLSGDAVQLRNLDIILPIGLSFHTFQSMSYTIEVYRRRQRAERHIGHFANYVLFFPQMVAGPIERFEHLGVQLKQDHPPVYDNFSRGFRLVLFGLFIKMAVADNIAPYVNAVYDNPAAFGARDALLATVFFSFQIYADFFGYSTIALGSARLLGIDIMDNFKTPYLSRSVTEFWTRWHISLSSWFRDYLYIPLGGNRVSIPRWCFNILVVFMVSGLWHGASWTFVAWGALHGLALLIERFIPVRSSSNPEGRWHPLSVLLMLKTFIVTTFIWIFFRAESFGDASEIIRAMFSGRPSAQEAPDALVPLSFVAVMIAFDLLLYRTRFDHQLARWGAAARWGVYTLIIFGLLALSGTQKFTFIYFQF